MVGPDGALAGPLGDRLMARASRFVILTLLASDRLGKSVDSVGADWVVFHGLAGAGRGGAALAGPGGGAGIIGVDGGGAGRVDAGGLTSGDN